MRFLLVPRFIATITLSIIAAVATGLTTDNVRAQDIVGGASRTNLSGSSSSSNSSGSSGARRPQTRYVSNTRTVTVTRTVIRAPNKGSIVVSAEPGAAIIVESVRGGVGDEGTVPADKRLAVFNDLPPGRYRVAAELEGYEPAEADVNVVAGRPSDVTLNMRPITFNVQINANVTAGEIRYAPVIARTDTSTGQLKYERAPGDARVTPITNGRAMLASLRPGTYGLDIRSDMVGYETLLASITLPGPTDIPVSLRKLTSSKTLAATWINLEGWDAPSGWRAQARKLSVAGRGIALPREDDYRYYSDFQLTSDVNMLNGVAASFVVRAQDASNYYLIQLTGQNSDEPYVLRGYVVRGGVPQRMGAPIPLDAFTQTLKANQFFNVTMKMIDNSLKVSITDSQTGDVLPLGILTDPARNFRIGGVGIAARDNEQNEIGRFIVCANQCPEG